MPLSKVFEIIEKFLGFVNEEQKNSHKSTHTKRRLSETADNYNNCINKSFSHSPVPLLDNLSVSVFLISTKSLGLSVNS